MNRRDLLMSGTALACGTTLWGAIRRERDDAAAAILDAAVTRGDVTAAVLHVVRPESSFTRAFGTAKTADALFLLGSISKPIAVTALMTLFDQKKFALDDALQKFIPKFAGEGRERVTMRHLLTHVSGLPDQLPDNDALRKRHAPLSEFVEHAIRTPLLFAPGTRYQYSSMAILLASRVAELLSGLDIRTFIDRVVFQPLKMERAAQGLGRFAKEDLLPVQTERAAPEAGGGDPAAKDWDWNSDYWRKLGAPWGGTHASAPDVARFSAEFLEPTGAVLKPTTAAMMISNHNAAGLTPRGLGWNIGAAAGSAGCSEQTFGHTGSTGTLCWTDPLRRTICVVLTTLPGRAVQPHPREVAAAHVAAAASAP